MSKVQGIKIEGMSNILRALNRLPKEIRRAAEVSALRNGGKAVLKAAKSFAKSSRDSGLLIKSLGLNVRKTRSGVDRGTYTARIGARKGFAKTIGVHQSGKKVGKPIIKNPAKYAHLVELGTSHSQAKPFIRPAMEAASSDALNGIAAGYKRGLAVAVSRAMAQGKI